MKTKFASIFISLCILPRISFALLDDWHGRLNVGGDIRLRAEETFNQDNLKDRFRSTVRLRLGATYKLLDMLMAGARMVTGTTLDNGSPYSSFDEWAGKKVFDLDQAYLRYDPIHSLSFWGGKFPNPFWQVNMTWDEDIQPEGGAARLSFKNFSFLEELQVNFAGYFLNEVSGGGDSYMMGSQAIFTDKFSKYIGFKIASSYYHFTNMNSETGVNSAAANSGTNAKTGNSFTSQFRILDVLGQISFDAIPMSFLFNYSKNYGAKISQDELYLTGVTLGEFSSLRNLKLSYQFAHIETDAVISDFAFDDITLATNVTGHLVDLSFDVAKKVALSLAAYVYQRDQLGTISTTDEDPYVTRLRLNVTALF